MLSVISMKTFEEYIGHEMDESIPEAHFEGQLIAYELYRLNEFLLENWARPKEQLDPTQKDMQSMASLQN